MAGWAYISTSVGHTRDAIAAGPGDRRRLGVPHAGGGADGRRDHRVGLALFGRLWSLEFGVGGNNGDPNTLYFTDGINGEANGLFGAIFANGNGS
jgi:hypothetical protein